MIDSQKVELIFKACTENFGVTEDQIRSRSREKDIVYARHATANLVRWHTEYSFRNIGLLFFSNRHHSTIIQSVKEANNLNNADPDFRKSFRKSESIVREGIPVVPRKRYMDLVRSSVLAYKYGELERRRSDRCIIGSLIYHKTGLRNTGWYQVLIGDDEDVKYTDERCLNILDYTREELLLFLKIFDNAKNELQGIRMVCDAAFEMEEWDESDKPIDVYPLLKYKCINEKLKAHEEELVG